MTVPPAPEPDDEIIEVLVRLARDADAAWRRLGGLTPEQQAEIEKTARLSAEKARQRDALAWALAHDRIDAETSEVLRGGRPMVRLPEDDGGTLHND